jgi:hypothetical protein
MRYQQFASHAYYRAAVPVSKMALQQEKAFCVLRFEVSISVITVRFVHGLELLVANDKLGQLPLLTVYVLPCKVRNRFLVNF